MDGDGWRYTPISAYRISFVDFFPKLCVSALENILFYAANAESMGAIDDVICSSSSIMLMACPILIAQVGFSKRKQF